MIVYYHSGQKLIANLIMVGLCGRNVQGVKELIMVGVETYDVAYGSTNNMWINFDILEVKVQIIAMLYVCIFR